MQEFKIKNSMKRVQKEKKYCSQILRATKKQKMIYNYSISQLSLNLILIAPFISRPPIYEKGIIESYYKIKCSNFLHSFLYSKSNTITRLKESSFLKIQWSLSNIFEYNRL